MQLRPYQVAAIAKARETLMGGEKRLLLVAPTGSGKTIIGTEMIRLALARGRRSLWLAHRRELVYQCSGKLGVDHGIVMASEEAQPGSVQVASVQTLARREIPPWDLLFIDEAHHATSRSYQRAIEANPGGIVIGLTATPIRYDGKGLGDIFGQIQEVAQISELVNQEYLVAPRTFAPFSPDLSQAKIVRGDYDHKEVDRVMGQPKVVGNVVDTWFEKTPGERTILFAASVARSKELVVEFESRGVPSVHLDGETPKDERDKMLRDFGSGKTTVLSNFGVLTEGFDCPAASVCILARPTASESLFLQMCGRITRPLPGKVQAVVLDHAGNTLRHGLPTEDREWGLFVTRRKRQTERGVALKSCPECYAISNSTARKCSLCGYQFIPDPREVRTEDGVLVEVDEFLARRVSARKLSWIATRGLWYRRKLEEACSRGYKPHWARVQYKLQWGHWPSKEIMSVRTPDSAGDPSSTWSST